MGMDLFCAGFMKYIKAPPVELKTGADCDKVLVGLSPITNDVPGLK